MTLPVKEIGTVRRKGAVQLTIVPTQESSYFGHTVRSSSSSFQRPGRLCKDA